MDTTTSGDGGCMPVSGILGRNPSAPDSIQPEPNAWNPMLRMTDWIEINHAHICRLHQLFYLHPIVRTIFGVVTRQLFQSGIQTSEHTPAFTGEAADRFQQFISREWVTFARDYVASIWCYGFAMWTWSKHSEFIGTPHVIDLTTGTVNMCSNPARQTMFLFEPFNDQTRTPTSLLNRDLRALILLNAHVYVDVRDPPTMQGQLVSILASVEQELFNSITLTEHDMRAVALRSNPTVFVSTLKDTLTSSLPDAADMSVNLRSAIANGHIPPPVSGASGPNSAHSAMNQQIRNVIGPPSGGLHGLGASSSTEGAQLAHPAQSILQHGSVWSAHSAVYAPSPHPRDTVGGMSERANISSLTSMYVSMANRFGAAGKEAFKQAASMTTGTQERIHNLKRDQKLERHQLAEEPERYLERINEIDERVFGVFGVPRMMLNRDNMSRDKKIQQGAAGEGSAERIFNTTVAHIASAVARVLEHAYTVILAERHAEKRALAPSNDYTDRLSANLEKSRAEFNFPSIVSPEGLGILLDCGLLRPERYGPIIAALRNVQPDDLQYPAKKPKFTTAGYVIEEPKEVPKEPIKEKDTDKQTTTTHTVDTVKTGGGKSKTGAVSGNERVKTTETTETLVLTLPTTAASAPRRGVTTNHKPGNRPTAKPTHKRKRASAT